MTVPYQSDNVFAKILRGEIPAHKVYEDCKTFAFMDVMPQAEGHVLVIPKAGSRGLLDADPAVLGPLMATAQRVAQAAKAAFAADGITLLQYNEPAGGQTVFHLHVHVIPRREGVPLGRHVTGMADPDRLAEQAARIRAALGDA